MKNKARFYDFVYPLYPFIDRFFRKQKLELASLVNALPAGNVLEIGIGNGSMLPLYRRHIVTGIDLSTKMLAIAKRRTTQVRVHLFMADGEDMKFPDESFDYVVINHVLSVVNSPERLLKEAFRVLKDNGNLFVLNHFTPDNSLRYFDRIIAPLARFLQFRSFFSLNHLQTLKQFQLQYQIESKPFGYFKILAFVK